jgi:hypothetical protein
MGGLRLHAPNFTSNSILRMKPLRALSTALVATFLTTAATTAADSPAAPATVPNTLTAAEKAAGWQLLFNGTDLSGWSNFKKTTIRPGWQVKDGGRSVFR